MNPFVYTVTIPKDAWHDSIACVTVPGITADSTGPSGRKDQLIRVTPIDQQFEWNVRAVATSFNTMIFKCNITPSRDVRVSIQIEKRNPRIKF